MQKYTFFAGAGISMDSPSYFPCAGPIMQSVIDSLTSDNEIRNELKKKNIRDGLGSDYASSGDYLRFEKLIEVISYVDKQLYLLDAIKNYQSPNLNHYNLAKLAIDGHFVFTTNFDDLIERAILNLGYNPRTICSKKDYVTFSNNDTGFIPVFKLHGSYYRYAGRGKEKRNAKKTIQATIRSIVSNKSALLLDHYKADLLERCIKATGKLVFVGYSGSDDFDIVPSLLQMDIKDILWIDHSDKSVSNKNVVKYYLNEDSGRSRLLRKQVETIGHAARLYSTDTSCYLSKIGKIKRKNIQDKEVPIQTTFDEHIIDWSERMTEDEKLYILGNLFRELEFYQQAINILMPIPCLSEKYIESQLLVNDCLCQMSRYKDALDVLEALLKIDGIEQTEQYVRVMGGEAYVRYRISADDSHLDFLFNEVLNKAEKTSRLRGSAMNNYALYLHDNGRIDEAMSLYKRCYHYSVKHGDFENACLSSYNLANIWFDRGEINKADQWAMKNRNHADLMGDHRQLSLVENQLANISYIRGDYDAAISYCNHSIERDNYLGNKSDSSVNELLLGQCYFEKGNYKKAIIHYNESYRLFNLADDKFFLYELLFHKIMLYIKTKKIEKAKDIINYWSKNVNNSYNNIEKYYYKISFKTVEFFQTNKKQSFCDEIIQFANLKEKDIIGFAVIVWNLRFLGVSKDCIGEKNIIKAAKFYQRVGNNNKCIFLFK